MARGCEFCEMSNCRAITWTDVTQAARPNKRDYQPLLESLELGFCPDWLRFRYARTVIPADMNIGGTTSTRMPLFKP